jgi:hypothetical protein
MATSKVGVGCWLGLMTLLWALHPLLFSRARGILVLVILTAGLALLGWLTDMQFLVVWSGGLGLFTLTLTLMVAAQPPNFWVGLSAGVTLLALLDGSQRYAYVRHCQIEAGVIPAMLGVFMRISGLSLAAGMALVLLVLNVPTHGTAAAAAGLLTIAGAGVFVGVVAALLVYTSRWPQSD